MVYYVKGDDWTSNAPPPRTRIQPIMYLCKSASPAESRYYSSEMEVACLVWCVRKIRHLNEDEQKPVVVYTDHASTKGIANHTHLGSSTTDKLNRHLIRASQYLSQFALEIRHRPGKTNVVADGLSRLQSLTNHDSDVLEDVIDACFVACFFGH